MGLRHLQLPAAGPSSHRTCPTPLGTSCLTVELAPTQDIIQKHMSLLSAEPVILLGCLWAVRVLLPAASTIACWDCDPNHLPAHTLVPHRASGPGSFEGRSQTPSHNAKAAVLSRDSRKAPKVAPVALVCLHGTTCSGHPGIGTWPGLTVAISQPRRHLCHHSCYPCSGPVPPPHGEQCKSTACGAGLALPLLQSGTCRLFPNLRVPHSGAALPQEDGSWETGLAGPTHSLQVALKSQPEQTVVIAVI